MALTSPVLRVMFPYLGPRGSGTHRARGHQPVIAQGREGFPLACHPLEGVTLALDSSPSWWTGSVVTHQGSSSFRVALASTGSQARDGGQPRDGDHLSTGTHQAVQPLHAECGRALENFSYTENRYACILLLNRKTRIF